MNRFKVSTGDITLGLDVEVFLIDSNTGKVVPAERLLPFVEKKLKSDEVDQTYRSLPAAYIHADGVVAEVTATHSHCRMYLIDNLQRGLRGLLKRIRDYNRKNNTDIKIAVVPAAEIDEETFSGISERGKQLGCDPERNIYINGGKTDVIAGCGDSRYRFAGGHIHVGLIQREINELNLTWGQNLATENLKYDMLKEFLLGEKGRIQTIKMLDLIVGNVGVLLEDYPELAAIRRRCYGKPGSFRSKEYGLEYRVLSNVYLTHPAKYQLIFGFVRESLGFLLHDALREDLFSIPEDRVISAIINSDESLAKDNLAAVHKILTNNRIILHESDIYGIGGIEGLLDKKDRWSLNWGLETRTASAHGNGIKYRTVDYFN